MANLRDYFVQMQGRSLSQEEKMRIYQRFLDKSHRVLMRSKVAYYSRVTAFSFTALIAVGWALYLFTPISNPYEVKELDNGLMAIQQKNGAFVHAEPIGRIITARGEMVITTADGKVIDGSDLYSNYQILLQAWAEILITVSNGFQAKIIGPARFMIEDGGMHGDVHFYTINLLEWDYLQLAKIENTVQKRTTELESIIVKTDDFHLESLHVNTDLDIVISTTVEGKKTITNHGDDILVKKIVRDSEKKIYAAVGEDQTVMINWDIELIEGDIEKFVKEIEDNQLTIRYELDEVAMSMLALEDAQDQSQEDSKSVDLLSSVIDSSSREASELAQPTDLPNPPTSKKVISQEALNSLTIALSASFVSQDLEEIKKYYEAGDEATFAVSYSNLTRRLQRVAQILDIQIAPMSIKHDHLAQSRGVANQILLHLEQNYYITPGSLSALRSIVGTLWSLQEKPFGTPKGEQPTSEGNAIDTQHQAPSTTTEPKEDSNNLTSPLLDTK